MKITLFWPPIPQGSWNFRIYPCLGSAYLDAVLRDRHDVSIIDSNIVHGKTAEFYKDYNENNTPSKKVLVIWDNIIMNLIKITERTQPEILCVGSWSYNMPVVAEFTRKFKARNPDIPIILGGANPTLIPNETLSALPYIDYLARGEGEETIVELVETIEKKRELKDVKGICFWKNNKIKHTPERGYIKKLDDLPFMDYENFIGFKDWNSNPMEFLQVMTTRGCVGKCSFCTVYQIWKTERFYSPEYVNKQIKHLLDLYDYKEQKVAFMDDNFVVNLDKTKKLINTFREKYSDYVWQIIDMRVEAMSKEFFDYISKNKCEFVGFGVESIHTASLMFLNKTINSEEYKRKVFKILDYAQEGNIRTMLSSILGTPKESKKDMITQANFFVEVFNNYKDSNFDVAPLVIHPATDLWYKYKKNELGLYKRPRHSPKRFYEGMFADKWDHLLEFVPNAYRIESEKMKREEFESLLYNLIKNKLNPLTRVARKMLDREKIPLVEYQ